MKPRLLDLFCCAGGAGFGYHMAGFAVTGADIDPQPRYPFEFFHANALENFEPEWIRQNFDAVHASPPCQFGTPLKHMHNAKAHLNLIPATRKLLKATGLPYIIENVENVREHLINPITLCGSMFDLGCYGYQLRRHRLFESNVAISAPSACAHTTPVVGVYGGHARNRSAVHGGRGTRDPWPKGHLDACSLAMGIGWMTLGEVSEAIPPAFTAHLGRQLLQAVAQRRAA